jgi:hypothetical protein
MSIRSNEHLRDNDERDFHDGLFWLQVARVHWQLRRAGVGDGEMGIIRSRDMRIRSPIYVEGDERQLRARGNRLRPSASVPFLTTHNHPQSANGEASLVRARFLSSSANIPIGLLLFPRIFILCLRLRLLGLARSTIVLYTLNPQSFYLHSSRNDVRLPKRSHGLYTSPNGLAASAHPPQKSQPRLSI